MRRLSVLLCFCLSLLATAAMAQEVATDRERALFERFRCVVCQNQTIDSSDAGVAQDLRQIIREQIEAGRSDGEIETYMVDRYGEFVLMQPVLAPHTILLWSLPILLLLGGAVALWRLARSTAPAPDASLAPEEERELARILNGERTGS